jgi:NTP pyrophosphatase (non-canonical NTP hydrolase)
MNVNPTGVLTNSRRWFPEAQSKGAFGELRHYIMGLSGESGECLEIVKKADVRGEVLTPEQRTHLLEELSDVLAYLANAVAVLQVYEGEFTDAFIEKQAECERRYQARLDGTSTR